MLLARILPFAGVLVPILTMAGCISHDDTQFSSAGREDYGGRENPQQPAYSVSKPEPGERSFLGFRLDTTPDPKRQARVERMTADPRLKPTPREQREARAMAMAQADMLVQDGGIRYRGDGSASSPRQVTFAACPGALSIDYAAVEGLNNVGGLPHALVVAVYHLSNRAAFDQLARHEEGLRRLLEGERFDDTALSVEQHYVQPGTTGRLVINRPENGRYVALVAGYSRPEARTSVYIAEYGLGRYEIEGKSRLDRIQHMFMPLPMHLRVDFAETEMWTRDTGLIYGDMRNVTNLMWRQTRYYSVRSSL